MAATLAWVAYAGRDLGWDVVNHHLYLPFSLLSGRFASDLFAAGPQAYQNPLGFVPFYALVMTQMPSWLVGGILGAVHALAAWPLYRLCVALWGGAAPQRHWRLLALSLAWATPAFLIVAGTSSLDVLATPLLLGAIVIVLIGFSGAGSPAVAGVCLGLAFAIKPVYATFALATGVICLVRCLLGQQSWRDLGVLVAAAILATLLFMGAWSLWLWHTFGNPIFPLFNDVFHSPYAPQQAIVAQRFLPGSLLDYVTRPIHLALYEPSNSIEGFAPDIRPLLALLFGLAALAMSVFRGRIEWARTMRRTDIQLLLYVVVAYALWMKSSGNARYAIPMLMIIGVLFVHGVQSLMPGAAARIVLLIALLLHSANFFSDDLFRMGESNWDSKPYFNVDVPKRLVDEPFLHLTASTLSLAGMAPFMNHDGAMINLIGQMSMPTDGPLGEAFKQRLAKWRGRTRILLLARLVNDKIEIPARLHETGDNVLYRFGLRLDFSDCLPLRLNRHARDGQGDLIMMSCAVVSHALDRPGFEPERARIDRAFVELETRCPAVLAPTPMITDTDTVLWQRRYLNSDAQISMSAADGVILSHHRSLQKVYLGTIDDVLTGKGGDPCRAWRLEMFR